jgi:hypothetical protein
MENCCAVNRAEGRGVQSSSFEQRQVLVAQSGRSGPWNSSLYQLPERNKESPKMEASIAPVRALFGQGRLIQRYLVLVFGTSRPSFIS